MTAEVAGRVIQRLTARGDTLATAESLTGGLVGQLLTGVPGASTVYLGGVIVYATRLKAELAGVDTETLRQVGPVSERTAQELARGVAVRCAADWGAATTGVAGPEPQDGHPVGEVWVAVAGPGGRSAVQGLRLAGGRTAIREQAAAAVLSLLDEALAGSASEDLSAPR